MLTKVATALAILMIVVAILVANPSFFGLGWALLSVFVSVAFPPYFKGDVDENRGIVILVIGIVALLAGPTSLLYWVAFLTCIVIGGKILEIKL